MATQVEGGRQGDAAQPLNPQNKGKMAGGQEVEQLDSNAEKCACDWKAGLKWTGVALAIIGVLVGTAGLLVYLGQLQLGLTGVGTMSATTGLYTMLTGYGVTLITSILLGVAKCLSDAKKVAEGEVEPSKPCANLCETKPDQQKNNNNLDL